MLRQKTREEKQFLEALSGTEPIQLPLQSIGVAEQIRLIEHVLKGEYKNMTWWRLPLMIPATLLACIFLLPLILLLSVPSDIGLICLMAVLFLGTLMVFIPILRVNPSARWIKGIQALIVLSKYVPAEESVQSLLCIVRLESLHLFLNRRGFAPELYERLALVLARLTEFTPDDREHRLLQRIALGFFRYPDPLRIAALLVLGDQPERLDRKFRLDLEARLPKELNREFIAVADDVLAR